MTDGMLAMLVAGSALTLWAGYRLWRERTARAARCAAWVSELEYLAVETVRAASYYAQLKKAWSDHMLRAPLVGLNDSEANQQWLELLARIDHDLAVRLVDHEPEERQPIGARVLARLSAWRRADPDPVAEAAPAEPAPVPAKQPPAVAVAATETLPRPRGAWIDGMWVE